MPTNKSAIIPLVVLKRKKYCESECTKTGSTIEEEFLNNLLIYAL